MHVYERVSSEREKKVVLYTCVYYSARVLYTCVYYSARVLYTCVYYGARVVGD